MKRAYKFWLGSRFFSNFAKQMQATAAAWQIYELTRSPIALGLIGLAQAVPFMLAALWAGHLVDRHEKRSVIMLAESGLFLCSAAFLCVSLFSKPSILLLYFILGLVGFCSSFEQVSTSAYGQLLIHKTEFPKAMGWNLGLFQVAVITGPISSGWLLHHYPARIIYGLAAGLVLISLFLASRLHPLQVQASSIVEEPALERVKMGLRFIWSQPKILSAMSLDMVAVLFGDVVALYPFFADRFGAGSIGYGFLKASPAIGSACVSAFQAVRSFIKPAWTELRWAVTIFGICMILFALSPNIYLAAFFLVISGAADGVSVIVRQSIYQALTPDHLRGRVASVSSIFISTSNEIGAFESGVAARIFGIVPSVLIGGSITLLSVILMTRVFRDKIINDEKIL